MAGILAWFWNERFWLPHNVTWADLKNTEEATFPQAEDLYLAFPLAFCIFMVRLLFERFVAKPCAIALNIQTSGPQIAQPNAILEKVFTAITKHPDEKRLEGLSKQLDWDVRSIQRWFRQRRNQEKPSTLTRFCESMWKFSFYLYVFTYGVRFLKKQDSDGATRSLKTSAKENCSGSLTLAPGTTDPNIAACSSYEAWPLPPLGHHSGLDSHCSADTATAAATATATAMAAGSTSHHPGWRRSTTSVLEAPSGKICWDHCHLSCDGDVLPAVSLLLSALRQAANLPSYHLQPLPSLSGPTPSGASS
ncbi:ceramide synthase 6-like [Carlito syrichta]|uniref:Ceramide synthase 6-like n=1 Tax=Carlito syrichta TaxID=1868482 RepID=A0A3Q0DXL2_CARSF|nr:ceramide synthase 6-like [Carlito syrichta]